MTVCSLSFCLFPYCCYILSAFCYPRESGAGRPVSYRYHGFPRWLHVKPAWISVSCCQEHSFREASQLTCAVAWVLEASSGGIRGIDPELLEQGAGGSQVWRYGVSSGLPAPGAALQGCGHVAFSWLSGSRAVPDPNERDLGTLVVAKILGPEYRLGQWPLIVHTLLGMIFPGVN